MSGFEHWLSQYWELTGYAWPLLGLGVVLAVAGLWGKRVGAEPRCRKCQYNLTGLLSDRCPECGTRLTFQTRRVGLRHRRRKCLVVGLLVCTITAAPVGRDAYHKIKRVDWQTHYPFFLVLRRAQGGDSRAFYELKRRHDAARLSSPQVHALMEGCLRCQRQQLPPFVRQLWINLAYRMDLEGNATVEQSERFHEQYVSLHMEVRPRIRQGGLLPFRLLEDSACPSAVAIMTYYDEQPIQIAGRLVGAGQQGWRSTFASAVRNLARSELLPTGDLPPGRYEVVYRADLKLICHDWAVDMDSVVTESRPVQLSTHFDVLPMGAPDDISLITDPAHAKVLTRALQVGTVRRSPTADPGRVRVQVDIACSRRPPIDFAFEVLIKTSKDQFPIGTLSSSWAGGTWGQHSSRISSIVPSFGDGEVYLILRSSPEVARNTVDVFETWSGRLTLGPFVVSAPPPNSILRGIAG